MKRTNPYFHDIHIISLQFDLYSSNHLIYLTGQEESLKTNALAINENLSYIFQGKQNNIIWTQCYVIWILVWFLFCFLLYLYLNVLGYFLFWRFEFSTKMVENLIQKLECYGRPHKEHIRHWSFNNLVVSIFDMYK